MKKYIIIILLVLESGMAQAQTSTQKQLKEWSEQHQFVKMDSLNNKVKTKDYFFYKALFANVCNNPKVSIYIWTA